MKARTFILLGLIVSLTLILTAAVMAREPREIEGTLAPAALGQPGLSFRYVQTFGETQVAYLADNDHLFNPFGVAVDASNNVYISEENGGRVMKYAPDGTFQMSIGTAGIWFADDVYLGVPASHIAVDAAGNVWVAQRWANNRVSKWDASGNFAGEWVGAFAYPDGVAVDGSDNIYIGDTGHHQVKIFDNTETLTATLGTGDCGTGDDQFCNPRGIAIDGDGRVYVADTDNHRVQIFDAAYNYLATLGTTGTCGLGDTEFCYPYDVGIGPGGEVYVADTNNNRVRVFSPYPTLSLVATLGDPDGAAGTDNSRLGHPTGVEADSMGRVYVADNWFHRVQQFQKGSGYSYSYVRTFGVVTVPYLTDDYHYNMPGGVAIDPTGGLLISEVSGNRLVKLNTNGTVAFIIGEPGDTGDENNRFAGPNDVATDSTGRIYVADAWHHRVQIYTNGGVYSATLGTGQGDGDYEFDGAHGVAVDTNGNIYVADIGNDRVQVYDRDRVYVATLGSTDNPGTGNNQFSEPMGLTVDKDGNIYVADTGNQRVQIYDSARTYVRTLGVTGECGDDFAHFCGPNDVAIDADGRIYVADEHNRRVQVFDQNGDYLTTIGGNWGTRNGENCNPWGVEVDAAGNVYIADGGNHRIQKFAPGVPGWRQVNINGFGDRQNTHILSLTPFNTYLYAGTSSGSGNGAQLWRKSDSGSWTSVMTNGFGSSFNVGIDHLIEFKDNLYAGTWADEVNGGEVWRSSTGLNWTRVVSQGFGDPTNAEVFRFAVFKDQLYAGTASYTTTHGLEIWRSSTGDSGAWTRVVSNGFNGDTNNAWFASFGVFNGYLYAGTYNVTTGGEVWRTNNGSAGTWTQVNADGFGTPNYGGVPALAAFNGYLYASTLGKSGITGASVWRCQACDGSDWTRAVANDGFGNVDTRGMNALEVAGERLYFVAGNSTTGVEVWRTANGTQWEQAGFAGFGDSNNYAPYWDNSVAVFNHRLYIGTCNRANGGEVWQFVGYPVYLPLVVRNR